MCTYYTVLLLLSIIYRLLVLTTDDGITRDEREESFFTLAVPLYL